MNDAAQRLIVALDVDSYDEAKRLVQLLSPHVGTFKIGSVLYTREGPKVCRLVTDADARLFLDLKFHDIPNTVAGAVTSALGVGADMLTLHVSGGEAMLRAAVAAREQSGKKVLLLGVTVLTHLDFEDLHALFAMERTPEQTMLAFAKLAGAAGLDGVVASAREAALIKKHLGPEFAVVTPGIRLADAEHDDQTRVVTPAKAIAEGADYLVVGRPVIAASDPVAACSAIVDEMASQTGQ